MSDKQYIRMAEEVPQDECRVCRVDDGHFTPPERPFRLIIETADDKIIDTGPIPMCELHLLRQIHLWEQAGLHPEVGRD